MAASRQLDSAVAVAVRLQHRDQPRVVGQPRCERLHVARNRIVPPPSSAVIDAGAPPLASAHIFVSTDPGLTLFTRTPCSLISTASASVREMTAPLLAQ